MLTRRAALLSTAALALTAQAAGTASARTGGPRAAPRARARTGAPAVGGARLTLPAPGGPAALGTLSLRLVDTARPDPWSASGAPRELMVDVRYPARAVHGFRRAPQLLPGAAAGFAEFNGLTGVPGDAVDWAATLTHARTGAPPDRRGGPRPVVLYSPGAGDPRALGTTHYDHLVSRGHVVVSVDHTYDATAVEFPGGRVERTALPDRMAATGGDPGLIRALLKQDVDIRVADLRFVLDALPDALPPHLRAVLDLDRVGVYGQSAGGFAALSALHDDPRFTAAADLDGVVSYVQEDFESGHLSTVAADGLERPFLLMGSDRNRLDTVPSWAALAANSSGWHRCLTLLGAAHGTYTDAEVLVPQIASALDLPAKTVTANTGTLSPARAVAAQRAYLGAFFDRELSGRGDRGLFDGACARFPEVVFS